VKAFYMEWRARVAAPSVDMSPFWVAQNAVAKVAQPLNASSNPSQTTDTTCSAALALDTKPLHHLCCFKCFLCCSV
jgi:hypothetical protein